LLGGLWILQTFPALIFGLFTNWFRAPGLLAGWATGFLGGTGLAWLDNFKPLHAFSYDGSKFAVYSGLLALAANILVAVLVTGLARAREKATPP
jgi:SSS family solute:Na+ symporter